MSAITPVARFQELMGRVQADLPDFTNHLPINTDYTEDRDLLLAHYGSACVVLALSALSYSGLTKSLQPQDETIESSCQLVLTTIIRELEKNLIEVRGEREFHVHSGVLNWLWSLGDNSVNAAVVVDTYAGEVKECEAVAVSKRSNPKKIRTELHEVLFELGYRLIRTERFRQNLDKKSPTDEQRKAFAALIDRLAQIWLPQGKEDPLWNGSSGTNPLIDALIKFVQGIE